VNFGLGCGAGHSNILEQVSCRMALAIGLPMYAHGRWLTEE
jgi:hypothetical protein